MQKSLVLLYPSCELFEIQIKKVISFYKSYKIVMMIIMMMMMKCIRESI